MASNTTASAPFFFIFDFYLMQGSTDDNDVVPQAILYFYPTDKHIKTQKLLDCGNIVGVVQYFQHDLFQSIPKVFNFQKTLIAHEHYGRHSAFLSLPYDQYTQEEAYVYLRNILDLFHILYGTWNRVDAMYGADMMMNEFLNQALTPIVRYVCNQPRSIPYLFSSVDYTPLKKGNQRVLLECKHCLDYLKSTYGVKNGLIGYDRKILYSSYDSDTNFYLQLLFQLKNDLVEDLIYIPWESESKLKNGVSLYRIYIRRPSDLASIQNTTTTSSTTDPETPNTTPSKVTTPSIDIFENLSTASNGSSSLTKRLSNFKPGSSTTDKKRFGKLILTDPSDSSEGTGFETDTMDELSSASGIDAMSLSSLSNSEHWNELVTSDPSEGSLTDEQKIQNLRSRSSTLSNDMEKTIEIDGLVSSFDFIDQIRPTLVPSFEYSDDDNPDSFQIPHRSSFDQPTIFQSTPDPKKSAIPKTDHHQVQVSWTNIPDKNNEHERDELVLYVQRNSRMAFAGVIEQSLLTDEYLKKLWSLMLSQMANMETEIQVISTANEIPKSTSDVKFQFNENTRRAEFERVFDGPRVYRKMPSEESASLALFARTELNRSPDRRVIGLSRGTHLISVDRRLPDRTIFSSRRFQETL